MGLRWFGLEFRMELDGHKPWVIGNFDDFHQRAIFAGGGNRQPGILKLLSIIVVEFVAMSVSLADLLAAIAIQ